MEEDNIYGVLGEVFAADIDAIKQKRRVSRLKKVAEARIMRDRIGVDAVRTYNELTVTYGKPRRLVDIYIWDTGISVKVDGKDVDVEVSMYKGNYEVTAGPYWLQGGIWGILSDLIKDKVYPPNREI